MDTDTNDLASNGFGNCLTRDGQGSASSNLPMGNFRHTGVGNGAARTDYAALGQLQDGISINWTTAGGTADALTATYTPAITALVDGQLCFVRAALANLTFTPTFAPNGVTARTITKWGGQALDIGDIQGPLAEIVLRYNLANTRWELLNPPAVPVGTIVPWAGNASVSGWLLCQGQNIAIATYPALNARIGTAYGNPGGGNITLPDLRGRVVAMIDSGGSARITVAGGNFDGTVQGGAGGGQNQTLTGAQLPSTSVTPTFTASNSYAPGTLSLNSFANLDVGTGNTSVSGAGSTVGFASQTNASALSVTVPSYTPTGTISAVAFGSGSSHPNVQPTIMLNYMIKT